MKATLWSLVVLAFLNVPLSGENVALVVGNAAYQSIAPLKNTKNDAKAVAESLRKAGYTVDLRLDTTQPTLEEALEAFAERVSAQRDGIGFFYYAGHGIQAGGENYLIPVDARISSEAFLKSKAVALSSVLDLVRNSRNKLNILVLDACRDNPFAWSRGGGRGLEVVRAQPPGSVIVYATSAGSVAADGDGQNGLFTSQLVRFLANRTWTVDDIFRKTSQAVVELSRGEQVPAIYSQYFLDTPLDNSEVTTKRFRYDSDYEPKGARIWGQRGSLWVESLNGRLTEFESLGPAQVLGIEGELVERTDHNLKILIPSRLAVGVPLYFVQNYGLGTTVGPWMLMGTVSEVY